ncbi:MAG: histidine kinase [Balneolales bacterium]|nr:histidine kinase [Balneolales bacterium]
MKDIFYFKNNCGSILAFLISLLLFMPLGYNSTAEAMQGSNSGRLTVLPKEGLPTINSYEVTQFGFDIVSNPDGVMFFSSLLGLGYLNGREAVHIRVPNISTFSVHFSEFDERIYAGGDMVFGYVEADPSGRFEYHFVNLLKDLPPEIANYMDAIWEIEECEHYFYLRMDRAVLILDKETNEATDFKRFDDSTLPFWEDGDNFIVRTFSEAFGILEDGSFTDITADISHNFWVIFRNTAYLADGKSRVFCSSQSCYLDEDGKGINLDRIGGQFADETVGSFYYDLLMLPDNTLMVATLTNGVLHINLEGEILATYNSNLGLPDNTVYGLYLDRQGLIWGMSEGGIFTIDYFSPFRVYNDKYGLSSIVTDIVYMDNKMFFLQIDGVKSIDAAGEIRTVFPKINCNSLNKVGQLLLLNCANNGEIWVYTNETEVFELIEEFRGESVLYNPAVDTYMAIDMRAGMIHEYEYSSPNEWRHIQSVQADLGSSLIYEAMVDYSGNIWFGTRTSGFGFIELSRDASGLITSTSTRIYFDEAVDWFDEGWEENTAFVFDLDEEIFLSAMGRGVYQLNDLLEPERTPLFDHLFSAELLSYNSLSSIKKSESGTIWGLMIQSVMTSFTGEVGEDSRFPLRKLYRKGQQSFYKLEVSSGDFTKDGNEVVFMSSSNGLHVLRENEYHKNQIRLRPSIISVTQNDETTLSHGYNNNHLVLDYANNELRFDYVSRFYKDSEVVFHRVKLKGFDEDWTNWNELLSSKYYTNLREGSYSFVVQSVTQSGLILESLPFDLRILPPWYRTWWAYIFYSLFIGSIAYGSYKVRLNQIMKEQYIRNKIASDLHDEVSATLSSISYFAEAADIRDNPVEKKKFIRLISESAGDAKEKISDIVWAINPEHDDLASFFSRCRRFATDLFESRGILATINIQSTVQGSLDMEKRQHLWMIFKEMLVNVARHSGATTVNIVFTYEGGEMCLKVEDNGKGIAESAVNTGNGLINIKKRASLLNAKIDLKTELGEGSSWNLKLKA